jgi:hypothetical protein
MREKQNAAKNARKTKRSTPFCEKNNKQKNNNARKTKRSTPTFRMFRPRALLRT